MAEKVDSDDLPPPIQHKALLNVDMGEGVGSFYILRTVADLSSMATSNVARTMISCH